MRLVLALAALMFSGFLVTACQEQSGQPAQPKIGVVDMTRLLRDSDPGKEGIKFLESRQAEIQKQIEAIQATLEKNPEDEAAMRELQKVYATAQQQVQTEGQNIVGMLMDTVQQVANTYRQQHGYDILVASDAVYSFNPKIDVTAELMGEVNKQKLDFKSLATIQDTPEPQVPASGKQGDAGTASQPQAPTSAANTSGAPDSPEGTAPAANAPKAD